MQVTKNITLDLLETGSPVIIKAKQNDRNTRYIAAHLYVDGLAYPVPSGTEIAFRYKKPDGTAGFYDTLPDNSPAITVSGNTVTVELVEQVLTVAGFVCCEINMYNAASEKLTTFTFEISVEESVLTDAEIISSDYYNVLTAEIEKALQAVTDATEQAENAAQSARDAADSAAMSKDWAAGQPVTYNGTPVSIAYAGAQRIASITAYGENAQGGTTEAPVALTGVDSAILFEQHTPINLAKPIPGDFYGVSVITNADGSVTVKGTATNETWPRLVRVDIPSAIIAGYITISLSSPASVRVSFEAIKPDGRKESYTLSAGSTSMTVKIKSGYTRLHCFLSLLPDQTIDETFHIMIAQGTEPVPFVPYVEPSITHLPIPRPLHKVGDVRDVCQTRVKSVYDKRIVLSSADGFSFSSNAGKGYARFYKDYNSAKLSPIASDWLPGYAKTAYNATNEGVYSADSDAGTISIVLSIQRLIAAGATSGDTSTYLSAASAIFSAHPLTVYYQSTAYDGTNGLDVCLTEYQTGFAELDGETLAFTENSIYWNLPRGSSPGIASGPHIINSHFPSNVFESNVAYSFVFSTKTKMKPYFDTVEALNAYLAAQKAAGTPVQVAYQLAAPEVYATDPVDFDNAAGPLTVMTGGEVEVRMTELIGSRSPELTGKMDKAVYAQVGNPSELDNDNFLHCVNQRNVSGTISAAGYFIDRWKLISGTVQITENGLVLNGKISQILENAAGTDVTASASAGAASYDNSTKTFTLTATGQTITWAKLEKGSVATPYVPKGYGAELVECYRYFWISSMPVNIFKTTAGDYFRNTVYFPIAMRTVPSVTILSSNGTVSINAVTIDAVKFAGNGGNDTVTSFSASADL